MLGHLIWHGDKHVITTLKGIKKEKRNRGVLKWMAQRHQWTESSRFLVNSLPFRTLMKTAPLSC